MLVWQAQTRAGYGVLAQGRECTINSKHRILLVIVYHLRYVFVERTVPWVCLEERIQRRATVQKRGSWVGAHWSGEGRGTDLEATWAIHSLSSLASSVELTEWAFEQPIPMSCINCSANVYQQQQRSGFLYRCVLNSVPCYKMTTRHHNYYIPLNPSKWKQMKV